MIILFFLILPCLQIDNASFRILKKIIFKLNIDLIHKHRIRYINLLAYKEYVYSMIKIVCDKKTLFLYNLSI